MECQICGLPVNDNGYCAFCDVYSPAPSPTSQEPESARTAVPVGSVTADQLQEAFENRFGINPIKEFPYDGDGPRYEQMWKARLQGANWCLSWLNAMARLQSAAQVSQPNTSCSPQATADTGEAAFSALSASHRRLREEFLELRKAAVNAERPLGKTWVIEFVDAALKQAEEAKP